ncbi:hypothetical protein ACFE04_004035 [Oxalis oulophora]
MKPVYFFCFVLILTLLPLEILSDNKRPDLVKKTCEQTPYKDYCNSILQRSDADDLHDCAEIILKTAKLQAREVKKRISDLSAKANKDDNIKGCLENFKDADEQIRNSLSALAQNRYSETLAKINAAIKDARPCVDANKKSSTQGSPSDISQEFIKTCSIGVIVTTTLNGKN